MAVKDRINEFIRRVENLYEVEYGDFKRKLGHYINRLEQEVTDAESRRIIHEMRHQIVYNPLGDIEVAREKAIKYATDLLQRGA